MSERIVYLSPYQRGYLAALREDINKPEVLLNRNPIDVNAIIYGSIIQCGVEKLEIPIHMLPNKKGRFSESRFLNARFSTFYEKNGIELREKVRETFDMFLPENYRKNPEFVQVRRLEYFVSDLMCSADRQISFMTLLPLPETAQLENQLPPELLFFVKGLLNSFELLNPSLPYPKLSIRSTDVKMFENIISSDLFSSYVTQHKKLEQDSVSTKNALAQIVDSGKGMIRKNFDFLQLREATISVLPITAQLVDLAFGKLPGTLADYFANVLLGSLKNDKRIVVYQLDSIVKDLQRINIMPNK